MSGRSMVLEGAGDSLLVFLPGFLNSPSAYADLLGSAVRMRDRPSWSSSLYARGPAVLTGRFTVRDEAAAAVAVVRRETAARRPAPCCWPGTRAAARRRSSPPASWPRPVTC